MIDPGDEPPFPPMSPEDITSLSEEAQQRQSSLKEDAAEALENGDRDKALEKLTEAILLGCASALMYSRRGQLLLKLGRPLAAVNDCTAATLLDSELASAYKTRARALSQLGQWEDAKADFEQALEMDYDEVTYQESLKATEAALAAAPEPELEPPFPPPSPPHVAELTEEVRDEQVGLTQDCLDALEDGEVDLALEKASAAIALGCADAALYCARARALLRLERPRAAMADCSAAVAVEPQCGEAFLVRGRALGALGQWTEAYCNLQEALQLAQEAGATEDEVEALRREAMGAAQSAGVDPAQDSSGALVPGLDQEEDEDTGGEPPFPPMSSTRELSDEALDKQAALKQACAEALEDGDATAALEHISGAMVLGGASALMYCKRAQVLLQLERPRAAMRDCKAALALNSQSAKALKLRARALAALERWVDARADYSRALEIEYDPVVQEESQAIAAKLEEIEREARLASRQKWEIVGGADKGGIVVREGVELGSPQVLDPLDGVSPHRLSTGAVVAEVKLSGDRLHFEKLKGSGPKEGWISIALKDKVLAIPMAEAGGATEGALEDDSAGACAEEPPFPPLAPMRADSLSEEEQERQANLKQEAADAQEDGDMQLALEKLTGAITLGCASALLYCRRAQVLLQLSRPRAAVNDCTAALEINPDSGKAFKIRARAHAKLKHWVESHSDFQEGLRIDYDEATYEESLGIEAKMKSMKAIATEKRLQLEQDKEKKIMQQEKAAEDARKEAQRIMAAAKAEEDMKMRRWEKMYMQDKIGRVAWQQGFMTDFMGTKRGKCKNCNNCPLYCWTPVRMGS